MLRAPVRFMSTPAAKLLHPDEARRVFRAAKVVCFDVDSTVVTEEGIDVLAGHCGAGKAVAEFTARAMEGNIPFHEALAARLQLMKPTLQSLQSCIAAHPLRLTPGVQELVQLLVEQGARVFLVSGGFRQMIEPVRRALALPGDSVFANTLLFAPDGGFAGYDASEPTSRAGGKAAVVGRLKARHGGPVAMVGDGATDLEARPPADVFVGFGGVAVRAAVRDGADLFVTDFAELVRVRRDAERG